MSEVGLVEAGVVSIFPKFLSWLLGDPALAGIQGRCWKSTFRPLLAPPLREGVPKLTG